MNNIKLFFGVALLATALFTSCNDKEVTGITLSETTLIMQLGEQQYLTATIEPKKADQSVLWVSSNINVVSVDDNGVISAQAFGDATITAKAGNYTASCKVSVNPADGVFINGAVWATCNVNAFRKFADTPESTGMFYQWNSYEAWESTGDVSSWSSYSYPGTTWDAVYDPCPYGWRVPTLKELEGLVNSGSVWTTQNGVNGRLYGTAPNQIFLPAAGERSYYDGLLQYVGEIGSYWSSDVYNGLSDCAHHLYFTETQSITSGSMTSFGFPVRCVAE